MYKKIGKPEKNMFEFYRQNPDLCQQEWHVARTFKEACSLFTEQVHLLLLFGTKDMKLQHLTAKMYKEWCDERYLSARDIKAYDEFITEVVTNMVKKLINDFKIPIHPTM